jgi:hypothetical protein
MAGSPAVIEPMRRILRFGALGAALFIPAAALVGLGLGGRPGLWAGALGALVPLAFFGVTVVIGLFSARMSTTALGVVVLGSWLLKMILLILVLVALREADFYDRTVFGVVLLVGTIGALVLEALVVVRTRVPYVDGGSPR